MAQTPQTRRRNAGIALFTRHRRGGRPAMLAAAIVGLPLAVLFAGGVTAHAQLANTFSTKTAVVAGGTMTVGVSPAGGVTISTSTAVSGCPTTGLNTPTVTYTCDTASSGIAAGTSIAQTFSVASGPLSESIVYNANGPVTGVPAPTAVNVADATCLTHPELISLQAAPVGP